MYFYLKPEGADKNKAVSFNSCLQLQMFTAMNKIDEYAKRTRGKKMCKSHVIKILEKALQAAKGEPSCECLLTKMLDKPERFMGMAYEKTEILCLLSLLVGYFTFGGFPKIKETDKVRMIMIIHLFAKHADVQTDDIEKCIFKIISL